jgi:hypothetical protein
MIRNLSRRCGGLTLAVVALVLLASASPRPSSVLSAPADKTAHLATQVSATLGAAMVTPRTPQLVPAPGQRASPGAVPAVLLLALVAGLLLAAAAAVPSPLQVEQRRLPRRRGPPRD